MNIVLFYQGDHQWNGLVARLQTEAASGEGYGQGNGYRDLPITTDTEAHKIDECCITVVLSFVGVEIVENVHCITNATRKEQVNNLIRI